MVKPISHSAYDAPATKKRQTLSRKHEGLFSFCRGPGFFGSGCFVRLRLTPRASRRILPPLPTQEGARLWTGFFFFVSVPVVSGFARITRLGRNTPQTRARAKPETLVGAPRGEGPVNVGSFAGVQVAWAILGWVGGYWVGVYWWWVCLVGGVIRFLGGGCGFLVRGRRGC